MAKFTPNRIGEQTLFRSQQVTQATRAIAQQLFDISQSEVPVVTGKLKASGRILPTASGWRVVYGAKYAMYVHDGTRPHTITAKRTSTLKFIGKDGNWVYRRSVHHPGTKANPWLFRSLMILRARGRR